MQKSKSWLILSLDVAWIGVEGDSAAQQGFGLERNSVLSLAVRRM